MTQVAPSVAIRAWAENPGRRASSCFILLRLRAFVCAVRSAFCRAQPRKPCVCLRGELAALHQRSITVIRCPDKPKRPMRRAFQDQPPPGLCHRERRRVIAARAAMSHGAPSHVTQDELRAALTAGASQRPAGSQMPESASENTKASSARRRGRAAVDLPAFEATVLHDSTYRRWTPALHLAPGRRRHDRRDLDLRLGRREYALTAGRWVRGASAPHDQERARRRGRSSSLG